MTGTSGNRLSRVVTVLAWLLALSFFIGAVTKFSPWETFFGPPYSVKFAEWGYPSWFRFVVGAGELVGGVMLLIPSVRFMGCLVLSVILEGAILTHVINHDPMAESIAAPVTLMLVIVVAIVSSPIRARDLMPPQGAQTLRA